VVRPRLRDHVARRPAADRAAAAQFAVTSRNDIARYQDVNVAVAAGYRPGAGEATQVHYENKAYEMGSKRPVMDPNRPQGLVYAKTPHGPILLGAMFVLADQSHEIDLRLAAVVRDPPGHQRAHPAPKTPETPSRPNDGLPASLDFRTSNS